MNARCTLWAMLLALAAGLAGITGVAAAELTILAPRAIWTVLNEIGPEFERSSGYRLNVVTEIAATLANRVNEGERFDVFIGPPVHVDRLIASHRLDAGTRVPIARSGIGVEVRAGAPKPDIGSLEAFKRTLLEAKSIGYLKQEGTSGAYLAELFERLGIAEAIKHKVVRPEADIVSALVAKGEIELGMVVITQIMTTPGVELVGPIPPEVQHYIRWSAAVSANAAAPSVARELIKFLAGPIALPVLKAQGMDPE